MYKLLVLVAAVLVSVAAQADRYPAGVNPALCPNYPNCDNSLLALYGQNGPFAGHVHTAAARYPAGVHPASCPNYPYCHNNVGAGAVPLEGFATRQYPAGVNAAACPNYPYC